MIHDSLDTLAKFRRTLCEDAKKSLVACLESEEAASAALHSAEAAIAREQAAASALDASDGAVECFAAWLPHGRQAVARAREAQESAVAATIQARAVLATARASVEAVEQLIEKRQAERQQAIRKAEQIEIDEIARRGRSD